VDDKGYLVGILSVNDLLELLSGELSDLAKLALQEQDREKEMRG